MKSRGVGYDVGKAVTEAKDTMNELAAVFADLEAPRTVSARLHSLQTFWASRSAPWLDWH
jgi:hypothetical protein